jgi:ABC-type glutathione transport system ATPase component
MRLMRELHAGGRTVVIITHDMNIVAEFAERAIVVAGGRIVVDGTPAEVFSDDDALREADLRAPQAFQITRRRPDLFEGQPLTVDEARRALLSRSTLAAGDL